jgi:hypothetical protein
VSRKEIQNNELKVKKPNDSWVASGVERGMPPKPSDHSHSLALFVVQHQRLLLHKHDELSKEGRHVLWNRGDTFLLLRHNLARLLSGVGGSVHVTLLPVLEGAIDATAALLMLGFAVGGVDAAVVRRNGPLARSRVDDRRVVIDFKTSFKEVNPLQSSCELRVTFSGSDGPAGPRLPSGLRVDTVIVPSIIGSRILDISVALGSNM